MEESMEASEFLELCDDQTKKKCNSFYKEAFLNRKEYMNLLEKENKQLKEDLFSANQVISEFIDVNEENQELRNRLHDIEEKEHLDYLCQQEEEEL